ncbi:MAG: translocation/assembly module TamB domain-containing protein, partial [Bacteroidales bacterium]|nr:translocation/assembly module TamB domain-containing protein [Bacteroidales bacterium]
TTLSAELAGGVFNADIDLRDSLIDIDLSCSANMMEKAYNADLFLTNAHLTRVGLIESDSDITVTTHLVANLQGDSLENMTGSIALHNTHATFGNRTIDLQQVELTSALRNQYKRLQLNSDWAVASMRGYFQYADLPLMARDFCDRYLPTYFNPYREVEAADMTPLYDDNINLDLTWNDEKGTFARFMPEVTIATGTNFHGSYNYGESLKTVFRTDLLAYNHIELHDLGFNSSITGEYYALRMKAGGIALKESPLLQNLNLTASMGSSISTFALKWDDDAQTLSDEGDLEFFLHSSPEDNKVMITRPALYVKGQRWNLVCPKGILANRERILVDGLKIYGLGQSMTVNAQVAGTEDDYVKALFYDFSLGQLCSTLMPDGNLAVAGTIDGTLELKGMSNKPYVDANLTVDNCDINQQPLGRLNIRSNYKTDEGRVYLDLRSDLMSEGLHLQPVTLQGSASLTSAEGDMDFDLGLEGLSLQTLKPLLAEITSDIDGRISGGLQVAGSFKHPDINGQLSIADGHLNLLPTGVTYQFDDTLRISDSHLAFDQFNISDLQGNSAQVDGTVAYTGGTLMLDLMLHTDRLTLMDKATDFGNYYGTLIGAVHGTVEGPVSGLTITANATALEGSEIYVPISNKKEINENDFVVFINPTRDRPTQAVRPSVTAPGPTSDLDLQLNVSITPGMKLHLPMDFDQLAANVTAVGNGDLKVSMQGGGEPQVLGDYRFTSGNFSLTLMQLIGKNFAIEQGSTLNFPGNINDARFDINAVYNLRANLATLMGSDISDNYVTVQDVISLSGTMAEPVIKFDIRLPNAEQSVTDQVFSYIDKKNEMEMLNQSLSLLLFGQFSTSGTSNSSETTEGINGLGLLTSSVGTLVTSMVKFVDVDFNYQAATANTASQWDVGISKRWNKLYFESTFGYGTNSEFNTTMANVLVGDVEMGYRFTPFFNFYGFHRTNTSYFTRNELPYKQGIGIKLTKDFDTFYDLFPWLRPKKKKYSDITLSGLPDSLRLRKTLLTNNQKSTQSANLKITNP